MAPPSLSKCGSACDQLFPGSRGSRARAVLGPCSCARAWRSPASFSGPGRRSSGGVLDLARALSPARLRETAKYSSGVVWGRVGRPWFDGP